MLAVSKTNRHGSPNGRAVQRGMADGKCKCKRRTPKPLPPASALEVLLGLELEDLAVLPAVSRSAGRDEPLAWRVPAALGMSLTSARARDGDVVLRKMTSASGCPSGLCASRSASSSARRSPGGPMQRPAVWCAISTAPSIMVRLVRRACDVEIARGAGPRPAMWMLRAGLDLALPFQHLPVRRSAGGRRAHLRPVTQIDEDAAAPGRHRNDCDPSLSSIAARRRARDSRRMAYRPHAILLAEGARLIGQYVRPPSNRAAA